MEIHAPEEPVRSIRDFIVHIAIVTIGILIALGLDGAREMLHEHRLVHETRENFDQELKLGLNHMDDELPRVAAGKQKLDGLLQDLSSGKADGKRVVEALEGSRILTTSSPPIPGRPLCRRVPWRTCRPMKFRRTRGRRRERASTSARKAQR